ncbi:hypothetical protein [Amycolatopsis dendrobii]|uniref:Uncharacterized protein n=1 Tax=Amycolatopsis dendrobii TaxID=2760662 RepID=A0A7W3VY40_9PSEU|nr:hypothetical protein [Amycolatopsis dendrobii]MBB1154837.1 hypothetical protein [Amycolatopsis dendrobii]
MKIQQSPVPSAAAGEAARRASPGSRPTFPGRPSADARSVRAAGLAPVVVASARGVAARLAAAGFARGSVGEVRP